jgi:hypothetical protein
MKTTLVIEDRVMRRLKALAAERGMTLSSVVEDFLRRGLLEASKATERAAPRRPLPSFPMGEPLVDLADREALDEATADDGRRRPRVRR